MVSGPTLYPYACPHCGATVYATASAEVGHVCRKAPRGSAKFTTFKKKES